MVGAPAPGASSITVREVVPGPAAWNTHRWVPLAPTVPLAGGGEGGRVWSLTTVRMAGSGLVWKVQLAPPSVACGRRRLIDWPTLRFLVEPLASETWVVGVTAGVTVAVGVGLAVADFVGVGDAEAGALGVTVAVAGADVEVGGGVVGPGMTTGPGVDLEHAARKAIRAGTATLALTPAMRRHVDMRAASSLRQGPAAF